MPPSKERRDAARALAAAAPLASRWIERLLRKNRPPLTVAQYLAMRAIYREGVSGRELAQRAGVSGSAVSQLLSGLAEAGLIEREPTSEDRRRQQLALSPTGSRSLAAADRLLSESLAAALEGLPKPEVDALARALPRVEAALSGSTPPRPRARPHRPQRPGRSRA